MVIAVIRENNKILLRKTDPSKNPYSEPWALFGAKLDGEGDLIDQMNREFSERWNMKVSITERLWWDEDQKIDHDGEEKMFIYLDVLCRVSEGSITPTNQNEILEWASINNLEDYELNPPTAVLLKRLGHIS